MIEQYKRKRSLSVIIKIIRGVTHWWQLYEMDKELKKEIEKLLKNCPKGCKCRQRGIENLCSVKDVGLEGFVWCLEKNSLDCVHRIVFGHGNYCSCPARVSTAKESKLYPFGSP